MDFLVLMSKAIITCTKDNIPCRKAESHAHAGVHALKKGQEEQIGAKGVTCGEECTIMWFFAEIRYISCLMPL